MAKAQGRVSPAFFVLTHAWRPARPTWIAADFGLIASLTSRPTTPVLAADLSAWLDRLIPESDRVTMSRMDARPLLRRFRDGLAKLMSPYL